MDAAHIDEILDAALSELRRQRAQLAKQAAALRVELSRLRGAVFWAVREFQHGDVLMAEQRLLDALEMPFEDDDCINQEPDP